MADKVAKKLKKHHEKSKVCYSRPSYREARWERAVKVYTINLESKYIAVSGVASVGVAQELIDTFSSYGNIQEYFKLEDYPTEQFTEAYLIKYEKINNARFAKRKMDNKSFFGGILHVFYAPEYESVDECRHKLEERRKIISRKTQGTSNQDQASSHKDHETVKDNNITSRLTITNTQSVTTTVIQSTVTTISDNTVHTPSSYQPNTIVSNYANTYPNQNNYLWNLPPLPPPPCETSPSSFVHRPSSRQSLLTSGHQNNIMFGSQHGAVPRFNCPSHDQPGHYMHSGQKRLSGSNSLSCSKTQPEFPPKKERKRI